MPRLRIAVDASDARVSARHDDPQPASPEDPWPTITQVPLVLYAERGARGTLVGHFDANNPHVDALRRDPQVTCLFHGPSHYVTPSIYPVEHYPGWNYVTVHVHARARQIDRESKRALLFELATLSSRCSTARAVFKLVQDKGPECAELAAVHVAEQSIKDCRSFECSTRDVDAKVTPERTEDEASSDS